MADGQKRYSGSIALTKLRHVFMTAKGQSGPVEGIFIPLAANLLKKEDNGAVYISVSVVTKEEEDQYKQNGFISKTLTSEQYKNSSPEQRKEWEPLNPILGSIKHFGGGDQNANSGNAGTAGSAEQPYDPNNPAHDDLPF